MKLSGDQVALIRIALNTLAPTPGAPQDQIDALLGKLVDADVHVMRANLMEDIVSNVRALEENTDKAFATIKTYITHVQKKCPHVFRKPIPNSWRTEPTDSCQICGK
jgi:hypothetical protein